MTISLVCCMDLNNGIGFQNELLIRLPNDMKHFKAVTTSGSHNLVLTGRKTFESIGKPLSGRINLILSRDKNYDAPKGCYVYNNFLDVINEYKNYGEDSDLWIAGGSEVYKLALPCADKIYLTIIENHFKDVDTFFPYLTDDWIPVSHEEHKADDKHPYPYHFICYERKTK